MHMEPSLEEAFSVLNSFLDNYLSPQNEPSSSSRSAVPLAPSATLAGYDKIRDQGALITTPPELRLRSPVAEPQAADQNCQQASQSASQAIQQASQQASQSVQQASQSASQAAQQASQSASNAIQQFSIQASQSIAAASRSISSAISSASFAIASAESSASQAVSAAYGSMLSAQASASTAQENASKAVLQAGAAVAAATGSAAAAGSSFLSAAARATESAQASVSSIGAAAASQVSVASEQVSASRTAAVTATQAALAIVGSIIASTLITILIYFLVIRHKENARRRSRGDRSTPVTSYFSNPKFPVSAQVGTTAAGSQSNFNENRNDPMSGSQASLGLNQKGSNISEKPLEDNVKRTSVLWNPSKPPSVPTLGSWLKAQKEISPFGPISLPVDPNSTAPLGGQLKSPLTSNPPERSNQPPKSNSQQPKSPRMQSGIPRPVQSPRYPSFVSQTRDKTNPEPTTTVISKGPTQIPTTEPKRPDSLPRHSQPGAEYRESKASVWTDDIPFNSPSPPLQSPPTFSVSRPTDPASSTRGYNTPIPAPRKTVRNTTEWFAARQQLVEEGEGGAEPPVVRTSRSGMSNNNFPRGPGFLRNQRGGFGARVGLPSGPGPRRDRRSGPSPSAAYVQGLNRFLGDKRGSQFSQLGSDRSRVSTNTSDIIPTPGVGKAL